MVISIIAYFQYTISIELENDSTSTRFQSVIDRQISDSNQEIARLTQRAERKSEGLDSERYKVGDAVQTSDFEICVDSVQKLSKVGSEFLAQSASDGGVYLAVRWSYKNTSRKPIEAFNQPSINLIAPDGTKYNEDIGAGAIYASEFGIDAKVLSDLNPGIKVRTVTVFEVSIEALAQNSANWRLLVGADSDFVVSLE